MKVNKETLQKILAERRAVQAAKEKLAAEWSTKKPEEFIVADTGDKINYLFPVLDFGWTDGTTFWARVPSMEGQSEVVRLRNTSEDAAIPSQVEQYKNCEDYKLGLIPCYTDGQVAKKSGLLILHYAGMQSGDSLDTVRTVLRPRQARQVPGAVRFTD